ncbi:MAG: Ig-like domain-containing protein, partial [Alistipes sp.]
MKPLTYIIAPLLLLLSATACSSDQSDPTPVTDPFALENVTIGGQSNLFTFSDTDPQEPIVLLFTKRLDPRTIEVNIRLEEDNKNTVPADYRYDSDRTIVITPTKELKSYGSYSLILQPDLLSHEGQKIASGKVITIATGLNRSDKFERIDDEALLTLVQQRTFRYFWDYGHPACGLARERTTSGDVVTTGGTGFGVMAMVVAAERGFVPRAEAAERVLKIATFLSTRAARFHGA